MNQINKEERSDAFDHLIYMRVYEGCNLHCKHCFIPANPKKMDISQVLEVKESVEKFAEPGQTLLFQWHGGEPTARGVRFFKEALSIINELSDKYIIKHSMQTNLINYNEAWRDIFIKYFNGNIGVSWDAKIRMMKKDKPESNTEYEKVFFANLKQLIKDGIEPCLVVTATKVLFETLSSPSEFFEFFISKGLKEIHVEKLTKTGNAVDNWGELGLNHLEYAERMSKLLKYYVKIKNSDVDFHASPFDGFLESVGTLGTTAPKGYGCNSGKCDTAFHTIDATGYKAGCTALTTNEQFSSEAQVNFKGIVLRRKTKVQDCLSCEFKPICNSGCATEDTFDGSGGCNGGYLIYKAAQRIVDRRII
ncbi:radical SAM protein [Vibrio splendidus]|nr:radical SAM protein [Vibrio splendidus]MCC4883234.1 radical SAM protein [Vibrio splendidus]